MRNWPGCDFYVVRSRPWGPTSKVSFALRCIYKHRQPPASWRKSKRDPVTRNVIFQTAGFKVLKLLFSHM